jgi:hypothetical protein
MCDELIAMTSPMNTTTTTTIAKHHQKNQLHGLKQQHSQEEDQEQGNHEHHHDKKKRTNLINNILQKKLCNVVVCNYLKAFEFCEILSTKEKGPLHNDGGSLNPKQLNLQVL